MTPIAKQDLKTGVWDVSIYVGIRNWVKTATAKEDFPGIRETPADTDDLVTSPNTVMTSH